MSNLVKKAGEQGLLMIDVPEAYGGAELGLLTSSLVGSELREASFSVAFGAHTTIGTLPIVFYGNEEQKQKYLPKLASGEWIAAYALTEPGVGSDAMGLTTRAELSARWKILYPQRHKAMDLECWLCRCDDRFCAYRQRKTIGLYC